MRLFFSWLLQFFRRPKSSLFYLLTITVLIYTLVACLYVFFASAPDHYVPSGDEPHFLIIGQTILKYHSLDVMRDYRAGDFHQFYPGPIDAHVARNIRGQYLPIHSIGGPLLWLLPFALFGRLGAVLFISVLSVLIIVNMYLFLGSMGIGGRATFITCLAYALASPLFIYAHLNFIEPIGALFCIYILRKIFQDELTYRDLCIASVLLGFLPWVHIRFALLEMPLFFILLYKIYRLYQLRFGYYLAYILPLALLFLCLEMYNYSLWGSLNPAANQVADGSVPFSVLPFSNLLLGLFFDQEYGLLINFPFFVFLLAGIVLASRKKFWMYNVVMFLVCTPYILVFTSFRHWTGGWNPPARFLLVLLPLCSFYVATALERVRGKLATVWVYFSLGYGLLYCLLATFGPDNGGFNGESGHNRTLDVIHLPGLRVTNYLPSMFVCTAHILRCNRLSHTCSQAIQTCDQREMLLFVLWISLFLGLAALLLWSAYRARVAMRYGLNVL